MKNRESGEGQEQGNGLFRFFISFGSQLAYIALILLTEELAGALLAFLPLVLMPLFECVFGFVFGFLSCRRIHRRTPVFMSALGGLLLAGVLYELADGVLHGWHWEMGALFYDCLVILALLLGVFFGIRGEGLRRKIHQRRKRFDD